MRVVRQACQQDMQRIRTRSDRRLDYWFLHNKNKKKKIKLPEQRGICHVVICGLEATAATV
ncbi:hypothetical protein WN55_07026 [Dufourea novaeangliae]|uniref:Uncharacterized protein n=1 Tax=Dufourea novaeangliae TaxID=178035 RepID=A0A154PRI7_DUFNO|nr:hypothetical protein WN55_07026 [Dufourea novaeangliae]